jgi:hypothetical protein
VLRSSIITCDGLPISIGGAHGLRTRSPKVALKHVRDFLRDCTDNSIPSDVFVEVIHSRGFRKEFTIPLVERLATKLGTPIRRHAGPEDIAHRWKLTADQIDEHVELIEQACPLPRHPPQNSAFRGGSPLQVSSSQPRNERCSSRPRRCVLRELFAAPRPADGRISTARSNIRTFNGFIVSQFSI